MSQRAPKFVVVALVAGAVSLSGCSSSTTTEGPGVLFTGPRDAAVPAETTTTSTTEPATTTTLYWDDTRTLPPVDADGNVVPADAGE